MRDSTAKVLATGLVAGVIEFATVSVGFLLLEHRGLAATLSRPENQ